MELRRRHFVGQIVVKLLTFSNVVMTLLHLHILITLRYFQGIISNHQHIFAPIPLPKWCFITTLTLEPFISSTVNATNMVLAPFIKV